MRREPVIAHESAPRAQFAERLEVLAEASREFAEKGTDPRALVETVAAIVGTRIGETCSVFLIGPDGELELTAYYDAEPAPPSPGDVHVRGHAGEGIAARVAATGQTLFLPAVASDLVSPADRGHGDRTSSLRSVVGVPLRAHGSVIGALVASRHRSRRRYTIHDRQLLEALADRAGVAIDNVRLLASEKAAREAAERAHAETDLLYKLTDAVNRARSLEEVFETSLETIERALGIERASILLFDADDVMRFKAWHGLSERYRRAVEGHSPWSADERNAQPIFVADVSRDPDLASHRHVFEAEGIAALAFVPLVHESRLLGKFMLYSPVPRTFSEREIAVASSIAHQVASAVGRKLAQRDRDRLIEQLSNTVRLNELFVAVLGHDLRNPLGAVLTSAQMLLRQEHGEELRKPLARILNSGERMARMIEQVLDFTRARTAGGMPVDRGPCDLAAVCRQVVSEIEVAHAPCNIELSERGALHGIWDADRLAQVASNLLGNAVQHGEAGGPVLVILDGTAEDHVSIRVTNRGALPEGAAATLFDPFRGAEARHGKAKGLGLGLYITREIVRAHGGSLELEPGTEDTTFVVTLPRRAESAHTRREPEQRGT